ncbi:50S ribosomal protein L13 [Candidatus Calescamantes bacterium]|nr:50S ribosomal protein L13 [Candidatus Calescamantes bacterium]MCK5598104.1 50S ribosomal protein L13 [bacterium]
MSTFMQKPAEVTRKWWVIDAQGQILGRLAVAIAKRVSGRDKVTYTPHVDGGDFVIVINAEKIKVTGNKMNDKIYRTNSGYYGHLKEEPFKHLLARAPERIIHLAVKGMLPKNKLRKRMMKRVKVFAGAEYSHTAQQPEKIEL